MNIDGVNDVTINDSFISNLETGRTDLDMYYEKVGLAYGTASGREIQPDYPAAGVDIQPKIDEYRIVGPTGGGTEISSIIAGDGTTLGKTNIITVTLSTPVVGLDVDTAFQVNGVTDTDYNGSFVVNEVLTRTDDGVTSFKYLNSIIPGSASPTVAVTINLDTDTVSSISIYLQYLTEICVWYVGYTPRRFKGKWIQIHGCCSVHWCISPERRQCLL